MRSSETTSYAYNLTTEYNHDYLSSGCRWERRHSHYGVRHTGRSAEFNRPARPHDHEYLRREPESVVHRDPLGHATSYTYDANGNKTSTTYPATATSTNTTSTTVYNQYSEPTSTTDELGNHTELQLRCQLQPAECDRQSGNARQLAIQHGRHYAIWDRRFDISSQPSMASQFTYDTNGNLTGRTDALGRTTSYTYDSLGHKLSMTVPLPNSSTSPLGRNHQLHLRSIRQPHADRCAVGKNNQLDLRRQRQQALRYRCAREHHQLPVRCAEPARPDHLSGFHDIEQDLRFPRQRDHGDRPGGTRHQACLRSCVADRHR